MLIVIEYVDDEDPSGELTTIFNELTFVISNVNVPVVETTPLIITCAPIEVVVVIIVIRVWLLNTNIVSNIVVDVKYDNPIASGITKVFKVEKDANRK